MKTAASSSSFDSIFSLMSCSTRLKSRDGGASTASPTIDFNTRLISSRNSGDAIAASLARTAVEARRNRSRRNLIGRSMRSPRISVSSSSA